MEELTLSFISLTGNSVLTLPHLGYPYYDFLSLFSKTQNEADNTWSLFFFQKNTPELLDTLSFFANQQKDDFPEFQKVIGFFKRLPANHYFVIAPGVNEDTAHHHSIWKAIRTIHQGYGIDSPDPIGHLKMDKLLSVYNLRMFGHQRLAIQPKDKSQRVCRFCGCKPGDRNAFGDQVSFKNKAHAIPEALGNKKVIAMEECDACNNRFSIGIELSLINLLAPFRTLYAIPGKNGLKTFKGRDFKMQADKKSTHLFLDKDIGLKANEPFPGNLKFSASSNGYFTPQNIYRCLCKFVISVISGDKLDKLSKTIDWVNGQFDATKLPAVALLNGHGQFTEAPLLMLHERKVDDYRYPSLVGQFHYANFAFAFIVPFLTTDEPDFTSGEEYVSFWKIFEENGRSWQFHDFQSIKDFKIEMDFIINTIEGIT